MTPAMLKDIQKLHFLLKKIDFLGIQYLQTDVYLEYYSEEVRSYTYSTPSLLEMKHLTQNRKRVLDIYVESSCDIAKIDAFKILDCCQSLEGLFIKSLGDPFRDEEILESDKDSDSDKEEGFSDIEEIHIQEVIKENEPNCWTKNVRDVVLCLNDIGQYEHLTYEVQGFFKQILKILKSDCCKLRTLDLFLCKTSYKAYHFMKLGESECCIETSIENLPKDLNEFSSLEDLTISTTANCNDINTLKNAFENMPNLRKLTLNVLGIKWESFDDSLPLNLLNNLEEVTLKIRPDFGEGDWKNLFQDISCLENLKSFTVFPENRQSLNCESFDSLRFVEKTIIVNGHVEGWKFERKT